MGGLPLSQSFLRFRECSVRPTHVQTKTSSGIVQHPVDCLCMWPGESSSIQWTVIYKVGVARLSILCAKKHCTVRRLWDADMQCCSVCTALFFCLSLLLQTTSAGLVAAQCCRAFVVIGTSFFVYKYQRQCHR